MSEENFEDKSDIRMSVMVKSELKISKIKRIDLHTTLTCRAANHNMTHASSAAIKIEINRK